MATKVPGSLAPDGSTYLSLSVRTTNTGRFAPDGSLYAIKTDGQGTLT